MIFSEINNKTGHFSSLGNIDVSYEGVICFSKENQIRILLTISEIENIGLFLGYKAMGWVIGLLVEISIIFVVSD